jgi:hypothetical protein
VDIALDGGISLEGLLRSGTLFLVYGTPLAYAMTAFLGIPVYLIFRKLALVSAWTAVLAAALIGSLLPVAFEIERVVSIGSDTSSSYQVGTCVVLDRNVRTQCGYVRLAEGMLPCALAGAIAGLVFWRINRPHSRLDASKVPQPRQ